MDFLTKKIFLRSPQKKMTSTYYTHYPAIIMLGYNRPHALRRALHSLTLANYPQNIAIELVICLDKADNDETLTEAQNFIWNFGNKRIVQHPQRIGLRQNILAGGDFSQQYGSVILLEDDICVSPFFYEYTLKALAYYANNERIGGMSLYTHRLSESCKKPFQAIDAQGDVYFMQFASWGHVWTQKQWAGFRKWYDSPACSLSNLPLFVQKWPETSWKKYFIQYMLLNDLYYVYARTPLCTNFGDIGIHFFEDLNIFQVPLQMQPKNYHFLPLENAPVIYDAYFELTPNSLLNFTKLLQNVDCEIDIYGQKDPKKSSSAYFLTAQPVSHAIKSYALKMHPAILNFIFEINGNELFLAKKEHVLPPPPPPALPLKMRLYYQALHYIKIFKNKIGVPQKTENEQIKPKWD